MIRRYKKRIPALLLAIAAEQNKETKGSTFMKFSEVRKAVVAVVGSVLTLLVAFTDTFSALSPQVSAVIASVVAVGTGVVTYLTRNDVAGVLDR